MTTPEDVLPPVPVPPTFIEGTTIPVDDGPVDVAVVPLEEGEVPAEQDTQEGFIPSPMPSLADVYVAPEDAPDAPDEDED